MKRLLSIALTIALALSLCACTGAESLTVPDLIGVDEAIAKNALTGNGLIPAVQYDYDNDVESGLVFKTVPAVGSPASKNDKITLYVSKGPSYLVSQNATISAGNLANYGDDDIWDFHSPYIEEGTLYIQCIITFGVDMSWHLYGSEEGFGEASINDTFDKTVPIKFSVEKEHFSANETQNITIRIPLSDLDVQKPTTMHLELMCFVDGVQQAAQAGFTMSW